MPKTSWPSRRRELYGLIDLCESSVLEQVVRAVRYYGRRGRAIIVQASALTLPNLQRLSAYGCNIDKNRVVLCRSVVGLCKQKQEDNRQSRLFEASKIVVPLPTAPVLANHSLFWIGTEWKRAEGISCSRLRMNCFSAEERCNVNCSTALLATQYRQLQRTLEMKRAHERATSRLSPVTR
jgi:hypothetical protein